MRPAFVAFALLLVALPVGAGGDPSPAAARRKELNRLQKEVFRKPLLVREDLRTAGPAPKAGRRTELRNGAYYEHHDAQVAFEALGPAMVLRMSLRDAGRVLLVTLGPPSDIRPLHMRSDLEDDPRFAGMAPEVNVQLLVDVDVDAAGGVREALASLVYLPGEAPGEEAIAACLGRYPDHDDATSRMRCGQP
jgi:hypothetical protein